jgi:hypothetical protein
VAEKPIALPAPYVEGVMSITPFSGGDNLAATFSPELADLTIYAFTCAPWRNPRNDDAVDFEGVGMPNLKCGLREV